MATNLTLRILPSVLFFLITKLNVTLQSIFRAFLQRRSLSHTNIATVGEEEKGLAKRQSTDQSRPATSANSTECLTKAVTSATSFMGGDRLVNAFAPGTMTFVMLKEDLKQHVLLPPTFKGHIYSDFSQLPVPFPYFSNPTVRSSSVHLVICVHGLEGRSLDRGLADSAFRSVYSSISFQLIYRS